MPRTRSHQPLRQPHVSRPRRRSMIPTSKCFKWHLACSIHDARGRIFPTCERARKDRLRPQHIFSGRRVSRSQYAAQLSLRARRAPSHNPPHRPSAWRDDAGALPAVRTGVSAWGPSNCRPRARRPAGGAPDGLGRRKSRRRSTGTARRRAPDPGCHRG